MKINSKEKFKQYIAEYNKDFQGWNFSYLTRTGRMQSFPLSWNYYNEIKDYVQSVDSLLDMGTGGGEFLAEISFLPVDTHATEGYEPNIELSRTRLESLGVKVHAIETDDKLPFDSNRFELVINRHESYSVVELKRILKKQGYFITQQVGGLNNIDLNSLLGAVNNQYENWDLRKAVQELLDYGFEIIKIKEDKVKTRFYDIGAIIYYLKAIPWQINKFNIDKYYKQLFAVHKLIEKQNFIDLLCHRFFIIAKI